MARMKTHQETTLHTAGDSELPAAGVAAVFSRAVRQCSARLEARYPGRYINLLELVGVASGGSLRGQVLVRSGQVLPFA